MVNFRYHLVSLIAVFAALAIGVVLGAGPLQARLGEALSSSDSGGGTQDQTEQLASAKRDLSAQDDMVQTVADRVLPSTLEGVATVTVALPGADPADVKSVGEDLATAGADLVGAVSLTGNWQSQDMAQYRDTLATPIASHLSSPAPGDAASDAIIGYALVEVLTSTGSEQDLLSDMLTDATTPILSIDQDPQGKARAIVVVGPRDAGTSTEGESTQSGTTSPSASAWAGLARAVASAPEGGVVLGDASQPDSMLSQVRTQGVSVTTVDPVGTRMGSLSAVLALRDAGSEQRAFGVGEGADEVLPPFPDSNG